MLYQKLFLVLRVVTEKEQKLCVKQFLCETIISDILLFVEIELIFPLNLTSSNLGSLITENIY